jgi:hypothetical protein
VLVGVRVTVGVTVKVGVSVGEAAHSPSPGARTPSSTIAGANREYCTTLFIVATSSLDRLVAILLDLL